MTQQIINVGTNPDDGTGDLVRTAFQKSNANFTELYGRGGVRVQRLVTTTPIVVQTTDQIINCNVPVAALCQLPPSGSRAGMPLTFKDLGQASLHPITITTTGGETIDGHSSIILNNNRQAVTFVPFNDGVSTGWAIE
jgi:hypothetical protein